MSATNSQSLIRRWLVENVQLYAQRDRVLADIEAVLARFHTIRPKSDEHTFDDGRTQILLCLHGLLPITYRQASYNIQISVWINRDYPRHPPIAYVVPTSDMFVKAGKFVDVSGRCNLEYMQQWERKSEGCSILALLEAMQDQFSREPPMYAKPKQNPAGMSSVPAQPPPLPASPQSSVPNPHDRPALPPKPGSSIGPSLVNQPTQPLPYSPNVKATPSSSINSLPSSSTVFFTATYSASF
ncbi:Suppressor protein stp22 of temperature-sensitive alpha-factor receptor and arginine permease [Pleurotus ostreatus]|nr:Suppressor protein stp22 of temperature-sensitive alpha-factor receptor and arginine permease [Pleurotus ostreatus]